MWKCTNVYKHPLFYVNQGKSFSNNLHFRKRFLKVVHSPLYTNTQKEHQSVSQFSRSVVSDSLWPHESQHSRPLCPSPTPGVYPNSCPSSWWCHAAISTSVVPFFFCPSIRVFSNESTLRMRWPKYWSFSFTISPSNEHPGLISIVLFKLKLEIMMTFLIVKVAKWWIRT